MEDKVVTALLWIFAAIVGLAALFVAYLFVLAWGLRNESLSSRLTYQFANTAREHIEPAESDICLQVGRGSMTDMCTWPLREKPIDPRSRSCGINALVDGIRGDRFTVHVFALAPPEAMPDFVALTPREPGLYTGDITRFLVDRQSVQACPEFSVATVEGRWR